MESYRQWMCVADRGLIVILIEQSAQMARTNADNSWTFSRIVADAVNRQIHNLIIQCTQSSGVRDWLDLVVLGYRGPRNGDALVCNLLPRCPGSGQFASIVAVDARPRRVEFVDSTFWDDDDCSLKPITVQRPVWVEAFAQGSAPACAALYRVYALVRQWTLRHPGSFPPIVLHYTSGESTDGDPTPLSDSIQRLQTGDGNVLYFQSLYRPRGVDAHLLPNEPQGTDIEHRAFRASSRIPDRWRRRLCEVGYGELPEGTRGLGVNADVAAILRVLSFGSSPAL